MNTERKEEEKKNKTHATLEEGEGGKEGERGGWGREMWVWVEVLLC